MALSGNLNDFSALETLQVIGIQQKTGTLEVRSGKNRLDLQFHEGMLVGCRPTSPEQPHPLLATLAGLGCCSSEDAQKLHAAGPAEAMKSLPAVTGLTPESIEAIYRAVIQAGIDRALLWNRGEFDFLSQGPERELREPWNVEQALLETMRRLDEAADLKAAGLRPESVPQRVSKALLTAHPAPSPSGEEDEGEDEDEEIRELIRRALVNAADGRCTLEELTARFALSEWDVLTAARSLREAGRIRLSGDRRREVKTEILLTRPVRARRVGIPVLTALAAAGSIAIGGFAGLTTRKVTWPPVAAAQQRLEQAETDRALLHAMASARLRTGETPKSVDELVRLGLWPAARAQGVRLPELDEEPSGSGGPRP